MPITFGRAPGVAEVRIDEARCTRCGLCVKVCKGAPLTMEGGSVQVDQGRLFGCIACGQCMAVCPQGCITVSGRDLSPADLLDLPPQEARAGYEALYSLLLARRSQRAFREREVEPEVVERVLAAANTAPMGLPPSEVGVLVFAGRAKVAAFRDDLLQAMGKVRWLFSPPALWFMRPFLSREDYRAYKEFVAPAVDAYLEMQRQGEDWFFYGAPLALYFYGTACADPADPVIAATCAMLACEALGLGSCLLGFPGYMMRYTGGLRRRYGLPRKIQSGLALILGYPSVRYHRALRRRFADVRYV